MAWSNEVLKEENKWYKAIKAVHKEIKNEIALALANLPVDEDGVLARKVSAKAILFDEKEIRGRMEAIAQELLYNTMNRFGKVAFAEGKNLHKAWVEKGGPGSGSWDGPGKPRFAHDTKPSGQPEGTGTRPSGEVTLMNQKVIRQSYDTLKREVEDWERGRGKIAKGALYNIAKTGSVGFVLKEGNESVGIVSMIPKGDSYYIEMLATKMSGGYGKKMMVGAAQLAAGRGKGITLESVPTAIGFYEKQGMHKKGEVGDWGQQKFYLDSKEVKNLSRQVIKLEDDEPEDGIFVAPKELWEEINKAEFDESQHPRGEHGKFSDKPGEGDKAERAKASHVPATKEAQQQGEANENKLAEAIKGKQQPDNTAFDVVAGKHAIEVKTIVRGKNDKITMHPESLQRKISTARKEKLRAHTVVFDDRSGKVYYRKGVGSFRLSSMKEVSLTELRGLLK